MTRTRPADEQATALATLTLFHGAVQHADDKARTIVAIQTMLMATVVAQAAFLVPPGPARVAQLAILAIFVPGYLQSSCHLLWALLPRMAPTSAHNRFSFPSVATHPGAPPATTQESCRHAQEVSQALAHLAMTKHRHIRRAMYGTSTLFVSALGSFAVTVVT